MMGRRGWLCRLSGWSRFPCRWRSIWFCCCIGCRLYCRCRCIWLICGSRCRLSCWIRGVCLSRLWRWSCLWRSICLLSLLCCWVCRFSCCWSRRSRFYCLSISSLWCWCRRRRLCSGSWRRLRGSCSCRLTARSCSRCLRLTRGGDFTSFLIISLLFFSLAILCIIFINYLSIIIFLNSLICVFLFLSIDIGLSSLILESLLSIYRCARVI